MEKKSGELLSHYRLIERVASGGMGVIWKAFDTVLERPVAIKVLPDDLARNRDRLARFEHEAKTLAALNHPGIVTIYSVESAGDVHFLTMEWVPGKTLDEIIQPDGLTLAAFLEIALPVADAVSAAQEEGITHRDLKPANVILSNSGRVKVLDCGRACSTAEEPDDVSSQATTRPLHRKDEIAGTLHYMAPETLRGARVDQRSDIFALGVLFYELATGQKPFRGESVAEITASILRDDPPPVTDVRSDWPETVDRIIRRCLDKDPDRRFQTPAALRLDLGELRDDEVPTEGGERSIAVLPFVDMSQEQDQAFFCDGIAEEVTNALSRIADLHVASRTFAFRFRAQTLDPREIGRRLGVKSLLAGSVRKAGTRLRITTELTDVARGYRLWSERFDREASDIFAIQDEIAESVVLALKVSLSPHERRAIRNVATRDAQAYEYYLRGRPLLYQHSRRGIESARQMFQRAIEIDPAYALAHAGIADCCSFVYLYVDRNPAQRDCALAATQKALQLDPGLAQVHVSHGVAEGLFDRSAEAIAAYERALELEPRSYDAHFFYARESIMRGEFEKAASLLERACEIRPDDYQSPAILGQVYSNLGRDREAGVARRRCVKNADEQLSLTPDDVRALYLSANAQVELGEVERGLERAKRAAKIEPNDCMLLYNVGCILSIAGQVEEALAHLERSVTVGNIQRQYFEQDSNLDALRDHPRFKALISDLEKRPGDDGGRQG
jgi:serine/threonine protein kinase/tetratricopeptide (TPR) repeat protein